MESFSFRAPTRVVFGTDCLSQLGEEIATYPRKCLIVAGRRAARLHGWLTRLVEQLQAARVEHAIFDAVEPNPSPQTVMDGAAVARREKARWILAVGGGSAIDAGKAIALCAVNQGAVLDYARGMKPERPALPLVAVPTTAGTGSEVTPYAILSDVSSCDKVGISLPDLFPRAAFLDPGLLLASPDGLTVDTGLDALCHALEAYLSRQRSTFTDGLAERAALAIVRHLPRAHEKPQDPEARAELLLASCGAGMAIANTATLLPHALGYPITVRYDVPHGRATAILLPAFLERLSAHEPERVRTIGRWLGNEADAPAALRAWMESLGVAPRLSPYGVQDKEIGAFSRKAMGKRHVKLSPGTWDEGALEDLYRRSL